MLLTGFVWCLSRLILLYTPELPGFEIKSALPAPETSATEAAVIIVDAGHGGDDGGTQGNGILEKDGTLEIAKALTKELRRRGLPVLMTREVDVTLALEQRAALANEKPRLCFVSVHLNQSGSAKAEGIETYYAWPKKLDVVRTLRTEWKVSNSMELADERGLRLAALVQKAAVKATGATERELRNNGQLIVLNSTLCPAILIECGFVSNKSEAEKLKSDDYQQKLAEGISDGIAEFLAASKADPKFGIHQTQRTAQTSPR